MDALPFRSGMLLQWYKKTAVSSKLEETSFSTNSKNNLY